MKVKSFLLFSSVCTILLFSCKKEPQVEPALLVGTYRVIDQNIPFPFLLEKKNDTFFLIDHKNKVIDHSGQVKNQLQAGDTLHMKAHDFFLVSDGESPLLFDLKDSLNFSFLHYKAGARFKPATAQPLPSIAEVREFLHGNVFRAEIASMTPNRDMNITRTWSFGGDSLTSVYSYFYQDQLMYQEQQTKKYHLFERQGMLFFSENELPEEPQMLYQITDLRDDSFRIKYYRNSDEVEEVYSLAEVQELPRSLPVFTKCLDGQPGEYYHDNITYRQGNDYLLKKIGAGAPAAEGDGYISIHFTISCEGKVGRPGLEQMDPEYRSASFSPALVKHLISEVTALTDWPEIPPGHFYKDVHAFLMFKIRDGKIIDLIP